MSVHRPAGRRRGSIYLLVLGAGLLLSVIGLAALTAARHSRDALSLDADWAAARVLAQSAAEHAVYAQNSIALLGASGAFPDESHQSALGDGAFRWRLRDVGGAVSVSSKRDTDVEVAGQVRTAAAYYRARLKVKRTPYNFLAYALHCTTSLTVESGDSLSVVGSPASAEISYTGNDILYGDVRTKLRLGAGMVTGNASLDLLTLSIPASSVFNDYAARATPITTSQIDRAALGPGYNPFGPNADGLYIWSLQGSAKIRDSHVCGTLIVRCNGQTLELENSVNLHSYRDNHPVLIVEGGNMTLKYTSQATLSESALRVNLNPPGAPFEGVSDSDQTDVMPSEIRGLVHIRGDVSFEGPLKIAGAVLVEGQGTVKSTDVVIEYDPALYADPPVGYGTPNSVMVKPGTWRRIDPW